MTRLLAILILAAMTALALAQTPSTRLPMGSPSIADPMVPGSGAPMVPVGTTSSSPPPSCSNAMDFSQACNSQYIGAI